MSHVFHHNFMLEDRQSKGHLDFRDWLSGIRAHVWCWLCQCLTLWCQWCSGELAAALSDCSQLTQLCPTGPEVTEPRWPGRYGSGLSVSLQGVAADTISHLADLGRTVTRLEIYGEQRQHGQAADIRAQ